MSNAEYLIHKVPVVYTDEAIVRCIVTPPPRRAELRFELVIRRSTYNSTLAPLVYPSLANGAEFATHSTTTTDPSPSNHYPHISYLTFLIPYPCFYESLNESKDLVTVDLPGRFRDANIAVVFQFEVQLLVIRVFIRNDGLFVSPWSYISI